MTVWSELCALTRWLLRRPEPPPPPGTGQRYQDIEQAAAQQRLLDHAAQLQQTQGGHKPTTGRSVNGHGPGSLR
ncbi:hypothetical protein GCM10011608_43000 [Micromonospora sonchi]|uniref:Uncharacterized protein n=1 Tax=Micromonospora sonchi TaxID=1763543 RepID=A0A917U2W3_9ACTN|nr:hypothetical protein GCM10011608_43000 [Micromonospora sonchi]